jgi:hypothetical protein
VRLSEAGLIPADQSVDGLAGILIQHQVKIEKKSFSKVRI